MIQPAEKIARRVVEQHNLIPPYDLHQPVAYDAILEDKNFFIDVDADGIFIG
ncbi:hypothetical protein Q3V30_00280 [Erwinia pyri]|uniref:Uncharacterized protein n=1 Tax=Erwinia pyri TaxID=3062598 RepID=A0AA50DL44_9GAMM|nr:hypothetical protein [Erwinia sp. DE2]WLS78992.1 hypothetical protein Q3V30_00280 [Erwinia sp. DE2]